MSIKYIATLDIGTTNVRCYIIDSKAQIVGSATVDLPLIRPKPGYIEIEPDNLLKTIVEIVHKAVADAKLQLNQIKCLSVTTQRSTFITWKKDTGEHLHNFITWNDMRATETVKRINDSLSIKLVEVGAAILNLFHFGKSPRYATGSRLQISNTHCTGRLLWAIENIPKVSTELKRENLCFGTVDTWLIYKLSGGRLFVSDISSASSTGLYDPFKLSWSEWPYFVVGIPQYIFPEVVANDYDFGVTDPLIFGIPLRIGAVLGDQQAALFGSCCFKANTVKITMGTGSFININTGLYPTEGTTNYYPLVGWQLGKNPTFLREAACKDAGTLIKWALKVGIASDISKIQSQVTSVKDTDGVFFIPAFSGLAPPISNENAGTGFIGVKATTTKDHLLRAILESIAFTIIAAYDKMISSYEDYFDEIVVAGGVAQSTFICQMLADMTEKKIVRYTSQEQTALGAAFMAGIKTGVWHNFDEIVKLQTIDKVFKPDENRREELYEKLEIWQSAADRFTDWY